MFRGLSPSHSFLIERGQTVSAVELVGALAGLRRFEYDTIAAFSPFDAVLTPGLSSVAPEIGWYDQTDAWRNFRQQVDITPWTSFVNVAGPAGHRPCPPTTPGTFPSEPN